MKLNRDRNTFLVPAPSIFELKMIYPWLKTLKVVEEERAAELKNLNKLLTESTNKVASLQAENKILTEKSSSKTSIREDAKKIRKLKDLFNYNNN